MLVVKWLKGQTYLVSCPISPFLPVLQSTLCLMHNRFWGQKSESFSWILYYERVRSLMCALTCVHYPTLFIWYRISEGRLNEKVYLIINIIRTFHDQWTFHFSNVEVTTHICSQHSWLNTLQLTRGLFNLPRRTDVKTRRSHVRISDIFRTWSRTGWWMIL